MRPSPFALIALFTADIISLLGNTMAGVAIPWFVLETTGSVTQTALTGAAGALPIVIAALVGGLWMDRVGYKPASVWSDIASGVAVALIPLLYAVGYLNFALLLGLVFVGALLDAPGAAARQALIPDLAQRAGWRLESVNSLGEVVISGAGLVGPVLAGLLITVFSAQTVLIFNAVSFALSALLIAVFVPRLRPTDAETPVEGSLWEAISAGLRFIWRDGPLRAIFGSAVILNFLLAPLFGLLLPLYMQSVLDSPTSLGIVLGAFNVGAVAGAVAYGVWAHRLPRRATFIFGNIAFGIGWLVVAFTPPVWVMVIAFVVAGLIVGPNGPLIPTIQQERTPVHLRGRVFSSANALCFAAAPLGFMAAGLLVNSIGLQLTMILAAGGVILTSLGLVLDKGLAQLGVQTPSEKHKSSEEDWKAS